jgi:hypothetical protein
MVDRRESSAMRPWNTSHGTHGRFGVGCPRSQRMWNDWHVWWHHGHWYFQSNPIITPITIHSYPLQPSRFNDSTGATSVCVCVPDATSAGIVEHESVVDILLVRSVVIGNTLPRHVSCSITLRHHARVVSFPNNTDGIEHDTH